MVRPRTAKGRARETMVRLAEEYPGSAVELCELDHRNAFELLVATILSAQSTDRVVNTVTPTVLDRWPAPEALALADPNELEEVVHSTGFFRAKARSLIAMARDIAERYGGEVPGPIEDLVSLPGVGRKTANVVRSVAMGLPGLPVDTHVLRLSVRLGMTSQTDPVKVEHELDALVPASERGLFSLRLILHGRRICLARRPACDRCVLADFCPSAQVPVVRPERSRRATALDPTDRGPAPSGASRARGGSDRVASDRVASGRVASGRGTARAPRIEANAPAQRFDRRPVVE